MDKNYLLTYDCGVTYEQEDCSSNFAWFESEEDLMKFIEVESDRYELFSIIDAIEIRSCRNLIDGE